MTSPLSHSLTDDEYQHSISPAPFASDEQTTAETQRNLPSFQHWWKWQHVMDGKCRPRRKNGSRKRTLSVEEGSHEDSYEVDVDDEDSVAVRGRHKSIRSSSSLSNTHIPAQKSGKSSRERANRNHQYQSIQKLTQEEVRLLKPLQLPITLRFSIQTVEREATAVLHYLQDPFSGVHGTADIELFLPGRKPQLFNSLSAAARASYGQNRCNGWAKWVICGDFETKTGHWMYNCQAIIGLFRAPQGPGFRNNAEYRKELLLTRYQRGKELHSWPVSADKVTQPDHNERQDEEQEQLT